MVNLNMLEEQSVSAIQKLQQTVNRLFAIEDFEGAVPICEELCSEVSKVNGELHDSCAEPYYQYATALLELAREENQLLAQGKLGAEDEEEEEEEVPSNSTPAPSASTSNGAASSSSAPTEPQIDSNLVDSTAVDLSNSTLADNEPSTTANSADITPSTTANNADITPSNTDTADNEPSTSSGVAADSSVPDNDEDAEEDITSLQIAWEVLELARVIYTRHEDHESCKKLARVQVKLGEVCMENEKLDEAIEHFEQAITTFIKGGCEAYSKDISSTYYLMGLAASLDQKYQAAKEHYTKCVQIMSASIMQLQSKEKTDEREAEISALSGMKAEVQRMVQDCADSLKQMDQYNIIKQALAPMIQAAASSSKASSSSASSSASSSSAQPSSSSSAPQSSNGFCTSSSSPSSSVSNISHLVRKTPASSTPSTPAAASSTPPASSPTVSSSSNASGKAVLQVSPMVSSTSSLRPSSSSHPFPSSTSSSGVSSSLDRRMGASTGFTTSGFGNSEAAAIPCTSSRPVKPLVSKPVRPIQRSGDISSSSDITAKRSSEVSEESNEAKRRRN